MPIPYDLANQAVIALAPQNPTVVPPEGLQAGLRVLAPIYNPRGYAKHWSATVLRTPEIPVTERRVTVAYDDGHGVGNYGPIRRGEVFAVDLRPLS